MKSNGYYQQGKGRITEHARLGLARMPQMKKWYRVLILLSLCSCNPYSPRITNDEPYIVEGYILEGNRDFAFVESLDTPFASPWWVDLDGKSWFKESLTQEDRVKLFQNMFDWSEGDQNDRVFYAGAWVKMRVDHTDTVKVLGKQGYSGSLIVREILESSPDPLKQRMEQLGPTY
jgi:hypothetical protein